MYFDNSPSYWGDLVICTGDWEIQFVSQRVLDNLRELA